MHAALISVTLALGALSLPSAAQAQQPSLVGAWASAAPENYGSHHATRSFVITDKEWSVVYRAFADTQTRQPLFTLQVGGVYVVGGPSSQVSGAHEGIFPATRRSVTADSEGGVRMFASMGCTLELGQAKPLVSQGCGFVPGTMQAMGEYDLVARREDKLYFGDRAADLTKARPAQLTAHPLLRQ